VRFLSSGFIHQSTPFGPLFTLLNFFEFCFKFAELYEFEIRTALWATAENQIFLEDALDLKLGWCRPTLVLFVYIDVLAFTVPLKNMASF
jgi:hypothetical protein